MQDTTRARGVPQYPTLSDLVARLGELGDRELFRQPTPRGSRGWSYRQVGEVARGVALVMRKMGLNPGDRVMLWAPNSPQWAMAFLGCLLDGIVPVPMDVRFRAPFLRRVAHETGARAIFSTLSKGNPGLDIPVLRLEELEDEAAGSAERRLRPPEIGEHDLAEILYTSGSTAEPRGVMLTHGNLLSELEAFQPVVPTEPEYKFLSVLPLSHIFEQMGGLLLPIARGGTVAYIGVPRPAALAKALREERPTAMMVVPRLLELLRDRAFARSPLASSVSRLLVPVAGRLPFWLRRRVFLPVHRALGGRLKYLVSGGAPLDPDLERFWNAVGMVVLQGYGLTETASAVSCNRVDARRIGSVGRVLSNQEVRIAADGEILVRGPNVTPGYYEDPDATRRAIEDGWLKTGDLGFLDAEGFLHVRGRKKEVIVTSGGINVYPEDVERALRSTAGVADGVAVEWRGQVHAVLLLMDGADPRAVVRDANARLDASQKIRGYTVWPEPDFPRTSTSKVKRPAVLERLRTAKTGERAA